MITSADPSYGSGLTHGNSYNPVSSQYGPSSQPGKPGPSDNSSNGSAVSIGSAQLNSSKSSSLAQPDPKHKCQSLI
jgi:hypothetical protein